MPDNVYDPSQRHGHDPDDLRTWRERGPAVLLKHEVIAVLETGYSTQETVVFGEHFDDESNPDRLFLTMPRALWLDMREPSVITVAVQPGDHLNTHEQER